LVPIEEEWPEPAQVEGEEERGNYELASEPLVWPEPQPVPPPRGETYELRDRLPQPPPPEEEPAEDAYAVEEAGPATERPSAASLYDADQVEALIREEPPPPPAHPYWSGLYLFPWRPENLVVWFFMGLNLSVLALAGTAMRALLEVGGVVVIGVVLLIPFMGLVFLWSGIYGSTCFLATVEETAAGNDRVNWPKGGGLIDGLGKFIYALWLTACGGIPAILFWIAGARGATPGDPTWLLPMLPGAILFPIVLLSALTAHSWWNLLEIKIVGGLIRKPGTLVLTTLPGLIMLLPCLWLAYSIVITPNFFLALGAGWVWAAFFLIYGRLLGRTGWMLTWTGAKARKRRPKRVRAETTQPAWGGTDE
jgi:hypothetical protein